MSYSNFKRYCEKKKEKKYEENRMIFEGTYLRNSLAAADSAQIWNLRCPTPRKFT